MKAIQTIFLITLAMLSLACSVEKARVNGIPPKVEIPVFKSSGFIGEFNSAPGGTVAFLWPLEKDGKKLTYDEQVDIRASVLVYIETIPYKLKPLFEEQAKIKATIGARTEEFVGEKCGLLAARPNPKLKRVFKWKKDPTEEEQLKIADCKANMKARDGLRKEAKKVGKQMQAISTGFYEIVGYENQVDGEFTHFRFVNTGESFRVDLEAFDMNFSSSSEDENLKVNDVKYDASNGYISFSLKDHSDAKGSDDRDYFFDLEIKNKDGAIEMGGSVARLNKTTGELQAGRISIKGLFERKN